MLTALRPLLDRWPLVAALASAAMLAAAHAFERIGGLPPCILCYRQREVYWVALAVAVGGLVLTRVLKTPRLRKGLCALLGLVFLAGMGVAIYHAGAEWKFWSGPPACASGPVSISAMDMKDLLSDQAKIRPPSCEEAAWVFLGLSMAGWNALVSLGLAVLSVAAARRRS